MNKVNLQGNVNGAHYFFVFWGQPLVILKMLLQIWSNEFVFILIVIVVLYLY